MNPNLFDLNERASRASQSPVPNADDLFRAVDAIGQLEAFAQYFAPGPLTVDYLTEHTVAGYEADWSAAYRRAMSLLNEEHRSIIDRLIERPVSFHD